MAKKLVPTTIKTHLIDQVIESITEASNTSYYAFMGDHITEASTIEEVNFPLETVKTLNPNSYRNMIFGKRLTSSDMKFVVNRHNWTANTVYAMYDDEDADLQSKNFYVVVDEDSYKHVYKCLNNNGGKPSTVMPQFEDAKFDADLFTAGDDYYETTDGYQWKYMYSIDSNTFTKFATQKYIPITANTVVSENASEGSIDVIKVVDPGKGYNNFISGQFALADFNRIGSNFSDYGFTSASKVYKIDGAAKQIKNFYQNSIIYLTSGVGRGQFRKIIYSVEIQALNGVFVELEENFTTIPNQTTTYEISPAVQIIGSGTETVNATARAIVDSTSANTIKKIEILEIGKNYSYASATVLTGDPDVSTGLRPFTTTPAVIRPILSPLEGHGANTALELGSKRLSMYMKYNRDESGLVSPTNTFAQFGIVRDPQFANVAIYHTATNNSFSVNEKVLQFDEIQIQGLFTANSVLSNFIELQANATMGFDTFLQSGDRIRVHNGTDSEILTVGLASNTTSINFTTVPAIATGASITCNAHLVSVSSEATVKSTTFPMATGATNGMLLNNAKPEWRKGKQIYGVTTKNIATITGIDINSRINDDEADFRFADFNQMLKINGVVSVGSFQSDEIITQGSSTARIHSVVATGGNKFTLNVTNVVGKILTNKNIVGSTSEAIMNPSTDAIDIKPGDLDLNTGSIIYLQNDIPVDRDENQSEEIRVILEF